MLSDRPVVLCAAPLILMLAGTAPAATINVPGGQPTIQAGINAAVSGADEVLVAPGTYNETINFNGKAITVRSSGGAAVTVIDGNGAGPVVTFATGEGPGSVLEGFTVTGGAVVSGAGILCSGADPTIVDCAIDGNTSDFDGAGLAAFGGSDPTLSGVTFSSNDGFTGGAVIVDGASSLSMTGGGFTGNFGNGGAAAFVAGSASFTGTVFIGNTANFDGGAVNAQFAVVDFVNCMFRDNVGLGSTGAAVSNLFSSTMTLTNCTFSSNAGIGTGGLHTFDSSTTVANCVFWGNTPGQILPTGAGSTTVTYCNVQGGFAGTGNIDANPVFADADGRLGRFSPCTDAGSNAAVPGGGDPDLDGNPRFVDDASVADTGAGSPPIVDIGAFERQESSASMVILVPEDQPTIQAAIDAASSGDEIILTAALYTGPGNIGVDYDGKNVFVHSVGGDPAGCVIDCQYLDRGFLFLGGETAAAVLEGVTIRNGLNAAGNCCGAIGTQNASPTINNCVFEDCIAQDATGGGGSSYDGAIGILGPTDSPTITNCLFQDNAATNGGAIGNTGTPTISGCTFDGNNAAGFGGAIYDLGAPAITGCTFQFNIAATSGGGLHVEGAGGEVTGCTFDTNQAAFGGGMRNVNSVTVAGCIFEDNVATNSGGGLHNESTGPTTIVNCLFTGNSAEADGGGIDNFNSSPQIINCTIIGNSIAGVPVAGGGGILNEAGSNTLVTNCIVRGNTGPGTAEQQQVFVESGAPVVTYSNIEGLSALVNTGDIDANPLFADADGRLGSFSPCTDAGSNAAVPAGGDPDLDENPRFYDDASVADTGAGSAPIVDMGAFERQVSSAPAVIMVPTDQPTIQAAIDAASSGDEIVLANGTYSGAGNFGMYTAGKNLTIRSAGGDPALCVINCQNQDRAFLFINGETADSVLEGITIRNGRNATGNGGGGVAIIGASPTFTNCVFDSCAATDAAKKGYNFGGAVGIGGLDDSPTFANCTFTGNIAIEGGAVYTFGIPVFTDCTFTGNFGAIGGAAIVDWGAPTFEGCEFTANNGTFGGAIHNFGFPEIVDCTFSVNNATANGGAISSEGTYGGDLAVTDCAFTLNQAKFGGAVLTGFDGTATVTGCDFFGNVAALSGAVEVSFAGTTTMVNCLFHGNAAAWGGGAIRTYDSDPSMTSCTFYDNTAPFGGGLAPVIGSNPAVANCIFWDNSAEEGPQIALHTSTVTVSFSDVQGGWPGTGNIDADPRLADADGLDDVTGNQDDDLRLFVTSPCIDAGDNAAPDLAGVQYDFGGDDRIIDGTVDMGAYEFTPTQVAGAGPRLWNDNGGGSFGDGANWLPDGPGPGDEAVFDLASTYTVGFGSAASTDRTVIIDGHVTFDLNGHTYTLNDADGEGGLIGPYGGTDARLVVTDGTLAGQTIRIGPDVNAMLVIESSGTVDVSAALRPDAGTLAGNGAVIGLVDNRGLVSPGDDPDAAFDFDALSVDDYVQTGGLQIEIGGTAQGVSHDWLDVGNTAALGGALLAEFVNGFVPAPGVDSFDVVTASTITSPFEVLYVTGLPQGQLMTMDYGGAAAGSDTVTLVPVGFTDQIDYADPETSSVTSGAVSVVLADLDGDALPDLAVALPAPFNGVVVLLNQGSGTFAQQPLIATGLDPADLVAIPLDNNASVDLAVVNAGDDTLRILFNDGSGSFTPGAPIPVGMDCGSIDPPLPAPCHVPVGIAAAQLVGGASADLAVVGQFDGTLTVFANDGSGGFSLGSSYTVTLGGAPTDVAVGDFDGNSFTDLIVTQGATGTVQVVNNNGSEAPNPFSPGNIFATGGSPALVCPEDVDNNKAFGPGATLDALVVDASGVVSFLINTGSGLGPAANVPVGDAASSISVIDMDADGDKDIAVVVVDDVLGPVVRILRNDLESGQLTFSLNDDLAQGENPVLVVSGDIDMDGEPDLVTINAPPPPPLAEGVAASGSCPFGCVQSLLHSTCLGDTDGSGAVDVVDLLGVLGAWGTANATYDIAPPGGDGTVDVLDLLAILGAWGACQ